jgi:aminoglycoside phosphotransferase (APT) family kinase protein
VVTRALAPVLLAPDPAVPARDLLLDPRAAAARLESLIGADGPVTVSDARLLRAKYRIGESLRVVLRITVGGAARTVVARTFRDGASAAAHVRALSLAVPTGDLRPVVHDPGIDAVWWTVPNDRRLRTLPALLRPSPEMAGLAGSAGDWTASELVELAPERSATARALDPAGRTIAFAKAYAPGTVDLAALALRYDLAAGALSGAVGVSAPRPLAYSEAHDLLLLEAMPGRRWDDLGHGELAPALRLLGRAIGTLHGVDPAGCVSAPFGRLRIPRVVNSAALVGRALPAQADAAARIARALAGSAPAPAASVLLHGDCHPKNALAGDGGLALIDLDQGALGDPAADIGSLIARLRHGALMAGDDPASAAGPSEEFLAGYAAVRPLPCADSLRWHTAAALVAERAIRAVNRVHPVALETMGELLDDAGRVLRVGALA